MNLDTILGQFSCDPNGEALYDRIIAVVKDGQIVMFEDSDMADDGMVDDGMADDDMPDDDMTDDETADDGMTDDDMSDDGIGSN